MVLPEPLTDDSEIQIAVADCIKGAFSKVQVDAPSCQEVKGSTYQGSGSVGVSLSVMTNSCASMSQFMHDTVPDRLYAESRTLTYLVAVPVVVFVLLTAVTFVLLRTLRIPCMDRVRILTLYLFQVGA